MKGGRMAAGLAAFVLSLGPAARAEELGLSLGAGSFFASQTAYRRVYGPSVALGGDVWFKLKGPLGVATGFGRLGDEGIAVPMDGGAEEYPVKFRRTSIPLVFFYQVDVKTVDIRFGAGLGIHSYKEAWQTVDLVFKGHRVSPRFVLAATVALLDRLSLLCSVTYDSISTGAGSPLAENVNLGGVQLLGGLCFRIF